MDDLMLQISRDKWAQNVFGKPESELNNEELYQLDLARPEWRIVISNGIPVEVNQTGTSVREIGTHKEYKIYHTKDSKGMPSYAIIYIEHKVSNSVYKQAVHQLVCRAFVPNPDPEHKIQVNHIDGHKDHNWYKNLEWVTPSENSQHALRTGLRPILKGEDCPWAKYTNDQIRYVCQLLCDHPDWTYQQIADKAGVEKYVVGAIYRGEQWTDIAKDYDFPERETISHYKEYQIHQVCQLLVNRIDLTYKQISEITGVAEFDVGEIYRGAIWKRVSDMYIFPIRPMKYRKDEDHPMSKYPNKKLDMVCEILDEIALGKRKNMSRAEISAMTGVSKDIVGLMRKGQIHIDRIKDHVFYKIWVLGEEVEAPEGCKILTAEDARFGENTSGAKYNNDQIDRVCCMLDELAKGLKHYSRADISHATGVSIDTINEIVCGRRWTHISKNHYFYQQKFGKAA